MTRATLPPHPPRRRCHRSRQLHRSLQVLASNHRVAVEPGLAGGVPAPRTGHRAADRHHLREQGIARPPRPAGRGRRRGRSPPWRPDSACRNGSSRTPPARATGAGTRLRRPDGRRRGPPLPIVPTTSKRSPTPIRSAAAVARSSSRRISARSLRFHAPWHRRRTVGGQRMVDGVAQLRPPDRPRASASGDMAFMPMSRSAHTIRSAVSASPAVTAVSVACRKSTNRRRSTSIGNESGAVLSDALDLLGALEHPGRVARPSWSNGDERGVGVVGGEAANDVEQREVAADSMRERTLDEPRQPISGPTDFDVEIAGHVGRVERRRRTAQRHARRLGRPRPAAGYDHSSAASTDRCRSTVRTPASQYRDAAGRDPSRISDNDIVCNRRRRQLDRQRQAVEPAAQFFHLGSRDAVERRSAAAPPGHDRRSSSTAGEMPDGLGVGRQRWHHAELLALDPEPFPGRRDHHDVFGLAQQTLGQRRGLVDDVLAVVQHQQAAIGAQHVGQALEFVLSRSALDAERRRHHHRDPGRAGRGRSQNTAPSGTDRIRRAASSASRVLPTPPGTDQRDQPGVADASFELIDQILPARRTTTDRRSA